MLASTSSLRGCPFHSREGPPAVGATSGNEPDPTKLDDIKMMVMPGWRERTAAEFEALFARSGFRMTRIVPTKEPMSVIEAVIRP